MIRLLITGANGHLGRRLIRTLCDDYEIEAVVRSERARLTLKSKIVGVTRCNISIIDPSDSAALAQIGARCEKAVHLIGNIKASRSNGYFDSHDRPAAALVAAIPQTMIDQVVYLSILGAQPHSASRCLRARARVEAMLHAAKCASSILRVPMVLGEQDRASGALRRHALAKWCALFRPASLEQPIYAGDVISAIHRSLQNSADNRAALELAGPESLPRRELVMRAARCLNNRPLIVGLPLALGLGFAAVAELTSANPKITRDMLRILDHNDSIDPAPACTALGLTLTPLDEMLRRCIAA